MPNTFDAFCEQHVNDIAELATAFADYQPVGGVGQPHVMRWLKQFSAQHRDLALKFARSIHYYGTHGVNSLLRTLKTLIDQQIDAEGVPRSSVFYLPGGRTAESGEAI